MKSPHKVYIHIRPRTHQVDRVIDKLEDLMILNPGAQASVAGIGSDGTYNIICFSIAIPRSNTNSTAISGLYLAQAVFSTLFDYAPCYSAPPTDAERAAAERFIIRRSKERVAVTAERRGILASS